MADLITLTLRLDTGRILSYRGVHDVVADGVLQVFTYGYLDPAEWRTDSTGLEHVISYPIAHILWWTERPYEGPPYVRDLDELAAPGRTD